MDMIIGSHVSFKNDKQLLGSVIEALSYGANTFMIYTGAPQNTLRQRIDSSLTKEAHELMKEKGIDLNNILVHAPYIINLANPEKMDFGISFLKQELQRTASLGLKYLVLHPGSAINTSPLEALNNIAFALNEVLNTDSSDVIICLETMAGKGNEVGKTLEELKVILEKVTKKERLGICLDTCHLNDAGYNMQKFDEFLLEFDKVIGLSYLKALHFNDSKNLLMAHKDRHANIGFGTLGFETLIKIIYHDKIKNIPKILETPYVVDNENNSYPPYKFEIRNILNKKIDQGMFEEIIRYYKNK